MSASSTESLAMTMGLRRILLVVAAFAVGMILPTAASAFDFDSFDAPVLNSGGTPETRAGVVPDRVMNTMMFTTTVNTAGDVTSDGSIKDVAIDLPPGMIGNPNALEKCDPTRVMSFGASGCPTSSQIGNMTMHVMYAGGNAQNITLPLYNIKTPPHAPAQFGFRGVTLPVFMDAIVRPEDHGISIVMKKVSQALPLIGTTAEFWGVPASKNGSGMSQRPLLVNSTECNGEPATTTVTANSWQEPNIYATTTYDNPPLTDCDRLPFEPKLSVQPASTIADAPSGYHVELSIPQHDNPTALVNAHLKTAEVTLPEGVSVSPSAADGLAACSEDEIGLGTDSKVECPEASRIGTVKINTPLMVDPMEGAIYQAEQDNNPFDTTLAIYLVPKGTGVTLKLPGKIETDPQTGQVTATFDDNPQLPFSKLTLDFNDGPRAPLANPATCGVKTTTATMTPWSGTDPVALSDSFEITSGPNGKPCAADPADRPFNPDLKAGVISPVAGAYSPFVFQLTRQDGDQEILSTTVNPPQGLTAKLAGIPYCSEQDIDNNSCPEASRIGSELAGAGAGGTPFYTTKNPGSVYLAGPYKGAPLSMVITEPVIAGPLDLDDISVRAAIHVDPQTAQLTVISDPIPQINSGIPLRVRDLRIKMDRPEFTIAPTNCDPMSVGAQVKGSHGATAALTNRFQVGDCASLGFAPNLDLSFGKAKKDTKANSHPQLDAKLSFNEGDANIRSVEVALPQGTFLDQDRLGRICSRANYAAETCPKESIVGYAKATTPLLDNPVEGPVYLKASDNPLPDLAADLNGQIDVDLFGKIDQKENRKGLNQIRNTFDIVPDVPVSDFELTLEGGDEGLLVNSRNICKSKKAQKVSIDMVAHNGMATSSKPLIGSACKSINAKKASKLKAKAKKLLKKAKKADDRSKAKQLRKQARKLKKQARKLGR